MNNNEMEKKIKKAFSHTVPDVMDAILSDCEEQKGSVILMNEKKKTSNWAKYLVGAAALFVLLLGGVAGYNIYSSNYMISSTVSLDVNPSIEIKVNKKEKVLEVNALNEDGKKVIGNMDFNKNDLDVTINAIIGSMLRNGYLSELSNSILISVDSSNTTKGVELQEKLAKEVNDMLQTNTFSGAVLSQSVSPNDDLTKLSDTYGISVGKVQLIKYIEEQNPLYSFDELVELSINDLNLLAKSGKTNLDKVESAGNASDKAYIGSDKAKEIALNHSAVSDKATNIQIELDYENGIMVYEIEFIAEGYEYEYEINATTGDIIKQDKEWDDDYNEPQTSENNDSIENAETSGNLEVPSSENNFIDVAKAKEIVINHSGVPGDSIFDYDIELDREHDKYVYEIDFKSGRYEYEYEINAITGEIIKSDKELDD